MPSYDFLRDQPVMLFGWVGERATWSSLMCYNAKSNWSVGEVFWPIVKPESCFPFWIRDMNEIGRFDKKLWIRFEIWWFGCWNVGLWTWRWSLSFYSNSGTIFNAPYPLSSAAQFSLGEYQSTQYNNLVIHWSKVPCVFRGILEVFSSLWSVKLAYQTILRPV